MTFALRAVVNALGHPMGQMIAFAGIIFNGIFENSPAFASVSWRPVPPGC